MLGALGQLMESEYTNPTELLGLNGEMDTELLGYLNALNPVQQPTAFHFSCFFIQVCYGVG